MPAFVIPSFLAFGSKGRSSANHDPSFGLSCGARD